MAWFDCSPVINSPTLVLYPNHVPWESPTWQQGIPLTVQTSSQTVWRFGACGYSSCSCVRVFECSFGTRVTLSPMLFHVSVLQCTLGMGVDICGGKGGSFGDQGKRFRASRVWGIFPCAVLTSCDMFSKKKMVRDLQCCGTHLRSTTGRSCSCWGSCFPSPMYNANECRLWKANVHPSPLRPWTDFLAVQCPTRQLAHLLRVQRSFHDSVGQHCPQAGHPAAQFHGTQCLCVGPGCP